ncbi:hypothetical protein Pfo_015253 [Paulownia fortunei]|nr:hypothetical protein Pfo_015253 [Paulownia fortunei]
MQKCEKGGMAGVDRISQLPGHILQNIFLLLPWEDAAHTTVLSKTWRDFWAMLPVFNFNFEQKFPDDERLPGQKWKLKLHEETKDFINAVDQALLDIRSEKAIIPKFRLCMYLIDSEIASHIDDWIGLATKNCIRELDLEMRDDMPTVWYCLPPTTFAAKSLEVLRLKGCKLEKPLFAARRKFSSLREVSLVDVCLDDEALHDIMFGCPSLEDFTLMECVGLKILVIPCLPKLKRLTVHDIETFERIDIEAINLESFHYRGSGKMLNIFIASLKYLKELYIDSAQITDDLFEDLISKLPVLKTLELTRCFGITRVAISHCFLENLSLCHKSSLLTLHIETPILQSFEYAAERLPDQFSINAPSLQESALRLTTGFSPCIDTRWFLTLRVYLSKFNQHCLMILSFMPGTTTFIRDELNDTVIPPLPVVKQLKLVAVGRPSSYEALLDGLLWSCHPEILAVSRVVQQKAKFIRFLCEKLIDRVEDPLCCIHRQIRCWRHYIKDARTEGLMTAEERNAFLSSLPKRRGPSPCPEIFFLFQGISGTHADPIHR